MPARPISPARVALVVSCVEAQLRKGYRAPDGSRNGKSAIAQAGRELEERGLCRPGSGAFHVRHTLRIAEQQGRGPDWSIGPKARRSDRRPAPAAIAPPAAGRGLVRIIAIPDTHLAPGISAERMLWLGKWAADESPDEIIQLGDLGTWDSVSGHAPPGTLAFEKLPRVRADFEAVERGLDLFARGASRCKARKVITEGNHEYRLERFEDKNPQIEGVLTRRFADTLSERDWASKPFREYHFAGGVGFIHIPINAAGKPYGGKTSAHAIARDALFSIVHGHTHVRQSIHVAKLGRSRLVSVISPGCALPAGHVEAYALHSATGWFWGAACLTVRDGVIVDEAYVSMETLERRYRHRKGPPLVR